MEKSLFKNESPSKFKKQKKNTDDFKIRKKFIVSDESSEMLSGKEN